LPEYHLYDDLLHPNDRPLMLIARNFHGAQLLLDYTTSKKDVLSALNRHLAANDCRATDPTAPDEQIIAEFTSLVEIAKATEGHPGHKSLIWIGRGFPSMQRDGLLPDRSDPLDAAIAQCTNLLRDARVTLYTIDPAGVSVPQQTLDSQGAVEMEDPFGSQVGFMQMATATGGQSLHGRNDIDRVIDTTVQDGRIFYSLACRPSSTINNDNPRALRKIRVVVKGGALLATPETHEALVKALESAFAQIVARAHVQGIMVFGGTLTPFIGSDYYHPSVQSEADRDALNQWIGTSGIFDAVIDFDKAIRDPAHPDHLDPEADSGDHLHPGRIGYKRMGELIRSICLDKRYRKQEAS
jgi:VWFA-related protein